MLLYILHVFYFILYFNFTTEWIIINFLFCELCDLGRRQGPIIGKHLYWVGAFGSSEINKKVIFYLYWICVLSSKVGESTIAYCGASTEFFARKQLINHKIALAILMAISVLTCWEYALIVQVHVVSIIRIFSVVLLLRLSAFNLCK